MILQGVTIDNSASVLPGGYAVTVDTNRLKLLNTTIIAGTNCAEAIRSTVAATNLIEIGGSVYLNRPLTNRIAQTNGILQATNKIFVVNNIFLRDVTVDGLGGVGSGVTLTDGSNLVLTNGSLNLNSNSVLRVGDSTGTGAASLRMGSGSTMTDYTGSESWNLRTIAGLGPDVNTVARMFNITNVVTNLCGLVLTASANLDFPAIPATYSTNMAITVTGCGTNDVVTLGVPAICAITNLSYFAFPSNDTVWVRCLNNDSTTAQNPGPAVFKVMVTKF